MVNEQYKNIGEQTLFIIKASLVNEPIDVKPDIDWGKVFEELKKHCLLAITGEYVFTHFEIHEDLKKKWKSLLYSQIFQYHRYVQAQKNILDKLCEKRIGVVVLKGLSVAQYYPKPELRAMGDIDIMVDKETFEETIHVLGEIGYSMSSPLGADLRHCELTSNNGDEVELHQHFGKMENKAFADKQDAMILQNIKLNCTVPDDLTNGMIILAHIQQHLYRGIGIRQVIDWYMFVSRYLSDDVWNIHFSKIAGDTGIRELAIVLTRACQLYLGLSSKITWCMNADETQSEMLMEYILQCGNFGNKRKNTQGRIEETILKNKSIFQWGSYLQLGGELRWTYVDKHPWARHFAWAYQLWRYVKMIMKMERPFSMLINKYVESKKKQKLLKKLIR